MSSNPFSKTSFVIITGATRGYGLELAKVIAPVLCRDSVLVLTGRNQEKLDSAQKLVNSLRSSDDVIVNTVKTDLGVADDVEKFIGKCTENVDVKSFQSAVIIHNAGSLGDVTLRMDEYSSQTAISQHMDLNVSNVMFYTAEFLRLFHMSPVKCFVVNISTLCAVEPFPSCALYCTGKAARDMMFKVLAAERPDVRVVSWAPGPMPTEMMEKMTNSCDSNKGEAFRKMKSEKTYVECVDSAKKFLKLLVENSFTSGKHIDYYD
ncbi:sepiapterin reductase-like [Clavelina lepadiformis]|uniref:sepiapterin reductase-like n=1 Tax=Clavelina lepadiformis TaxID=159417 RepID=UPI00404316F1